MATFNFRNKNIYYEVHGEGKTPLVILNGIMMSAISWYMFLPELTKDHKLVFVDFFDQGKSDKMEESYTHSLQVEVVKALVDELKLEKINLFGISYGGEIALQFALKHQEYVNKLLLFNTAAYTNPWLHDIGRGWIGAAQTGSGETFYNVSIPVIYSPSFYTKNYQWMSERKALLYSVFTKEFLDSMIRLTESSEGYDVREKLHTLKVDTMIVSSEQDFITPPADQIYLHENIGSSKYLVIKNCGHASMYEKPNEFLSIIKGFLSIEKEIKIV